MVLPDEKIAIAVLTNQEASPAASEIASAISKLIVAKSATVAATTLKPEEAQMTAIMRGLQDGIIDRGMFTDDANYYFSKETIEDFASSLKPLGAVTEVKKQSESLRGGMTFRTFEVEFAGGESVTITTYTMANGLLEQLLVEGKN